MIVIKYIPNILKDEGRRQIELPYESDRILLSYLGQTDFPYDECKVIVTGKRIKDLSIFLKDGDEVIITPEIKDIFSLIYTAISAIWTAVIAHPFIATIFILSVAYSIYSAMTMKQRKPNFGLTSDGIDESSPTYGWEGITTTQDVGIPIPIVYGEHRVGGNIINQYIRTDGDKKYLNVLLGLCEGEVDSISELKINDNPAENFSDVSLTTRLGANSQAQISAFNDSHDLQPLNVELTKDDPYVHTTVNSDITAFEVNIELTGGLFQQPTNGGIEAWSVTIKIEYKLHTAGDYTQLGEYTISDKNRSDIRRVYRKEGLDAGQYDIRVTRISDDTQLDPLKQGDSYLTGIDEIAQDEPLIYPNVALAGIEALATEQLNGATPNFSILVKGKKVRIPDVREEEGGSVVLWEDYYWDAENMVFRGFSDDRELYWDGSTYIEGFSANPIWCLRDLLINARYGLGDYITTSLIDDTQLLEMAKYCDEKTSDGASSYEKRFRLDVVIDSASRAIDIINQLCATFRCFVFYSNGAVKLKIDKADTPVQMFGMGNIISSSFVQSWKSIKEIPNVIEIQFMDAEKDYKQETIAVFDEISIGNGDPLRKKGLRLFCTRISQCIREGRYLINVAKNIHRTVTLKAGIDAIACQAGDLVNIAHDIPQWGYSGRVQADSTTTLVKLDRTVTIEGGKSYKVRVRFADDTQEEKTVISTAGSYTEVETEAFSQGPQAYDVYSFGEDNIVVKPFRVIGIKRSGNSEVELICLEYNADVYDTDTISLPDDNYSDLETEVPVVTDLNLTEGIVVLPDGTVRSTIEVWFQKPDDTNYRNKYHFAKIYLSDDAGASYQLVGQAYGNNSVIQVDFYDPKTYYVKVLTVCTNGIEDILSNAPFDTILVAGKNATPSDVTGFEIFQEGNFLHFSWEAISDADLARYIIKKGSEWSTGQTIAELIDTTEFIYPVGEIGEVVFMIKAKDTSGNESENPDIDTITITAPPEMNFINDFDLWYRDLTYLLSDLALIKANYHDAGYVRDCLALSTASHWEDKEGLGKTWEQAETDGDLVLDGTSEVSGYFQMITPLDLETVFEFKIITDADYKNVSGASLAIYISYSDDGVNYTSFELVSSNEVYRARYIKFKVMISTTDTSKHVYLYDLLIYINAPVTKVAWLRDVLIPDTGKSILFGANFTYPPKVTISIVNGVVGIPIIDNKTKDGCNIKVYNTSGVEIGTAEVDVDAKGY